ncbi:MAG: hypothetical protein WC405_19125 [Syntrophales bacterium]
MDLSEKLRKHDQAQKDILLKTPEKVTAVEEKSDYTFEVRTNTGDSYRSKTLINASGGQGQASRSAGGKPGWMAREWLIALPVMFPFIRIRTPRW